MQVTFCVRPTRYISTLFRLLLKREPADKAFAAAPRKGGVTRLVEADQKCMYWWGEVNFQRQSIASRPQGQPPRRQAAAIFASVATIDEVNKGQNG